MIDKWNFGAARQHPASPVKHWGQPLAGKMRLRPIVRHGPYPSDDGHVPDVVRPVLLPPEADLVAPDSLAERDLLAQAVVIRNASIMRLAPSCDSWHLTGYEVVRGDQEGRYVRPDLTPISCDDLHRPLEPDLLAAARLLVPRHQVLQAGVAVGLAATRAEIENDGLMGLITGSTVTERVAGLIAAVVANGMQRGFDVGRSWGYALNCAYPWLEDQRGLEPLLPVLDATVLLHPPVAPSDVDVVADLGWLLHHQHAQGEQAWSERSRP